jgi:hypothetical protein
VDSYQFIWTSGTSYPLKYMDMYECVRENKIKRMFYNVKYIIVAQV